MRSFLATTLWLALGCAALSGVFWVFLNTPESTVWALAGSALLVLAMVGVAAVTLNGALLAGRVGWSGATMRRAVSGVFGFVLPLLLVVAAWWTVGRALGWLEVYSGEISAWFIATLGWSDVRPAIELVGWFGFWIRTIAVPVIALVWLEGVLADGLLSSFSRTTVRRALSPFRLIAATLIFAVLVWVPWRYLAYWTPRGLPATWVEPAFVASKFAVVVFCAAAGMALLTRLISRRV